MDELISELNTRGVNLIKTVDITMLPLKENRGYSVAILIGIVLSPSYIMRLSKENIPDHSEFGETERLVGKVAEWTAEFIIKKGYKAFAQSDRNLIHKFYDKTTKTTQLPHKKIAVLSGLGWIGKSNLFITQEYGSAVCLSTILTNAPLSSESRNVIMPKCGECTICKEICPTGAIYGTTWRPGIDRDNIVDVYRCDGCLKCMVNCPWTQKYMNINCISH